MMAQGDSLFRFVIEMTDSNQNLQQKLEFRISRHPFETMSYLLCRVLSYCLHYGPKVLLSKGVCQGDEPPMGLKTENNRYVLWADIGWPTKNK